MISLTESNTFFEVASKIFSQKIKSNTTYKMYCMIINNQTNRYPYSQLSCKMFGQGSIVYLPNLPRLGRAGKKKLENIGYVSYRED